MAESDSTARTPSERAAYHRGLITVYQDRLTAAGGVRAAVDPEGRQALDSLVRDITPFLYLVGREAVTVRFGVNPPGGILDDCVSEMLVVVLDSVAKFDPARCPSFTSWMARENSEMRQALSAFLNFTIEADGLDRRAYRVVSIAKTAEALFVEREHRTPTLAELQQATEDYCYDYQFEKLTAEQQQLPEEEWRKLVRAKLVNQSIIAGIRDLQDLQLISNGPVSVEWFATRWDHVESCSPEVEVRDSLPTELRQDYDDMRGLIRVAVGGLPDADVSIVAARLGAEGKPEAASTVAEQFNVPVTHVKDITANAVARMGAAHAQYAFLAPGISGQFERAQPTGGGTDGALQRLRAQRAAA